MEQLTFVTGNPNKLRGAQTILEPLGFIISGVALNIAEIQDESENPGEVITRDKAQKAYDMLQKPLVVTDDSWDVPALNGFPGPYMKSVNHWFSADDFLRLTATLVDRRVFLHQHLIYQDKDGQQLFVATIPGTIQTESRGDTADEPWATVVSLQEDGRTIAEIRDTGGSAIAHHRSAWHLFAEWLEQQKT